MSSTACQLVVCDLEGEERTAENMEVSDGLLLQVNNGEQWCNRWKRPNDDSVSHKHFICIVSLYSRSRITRLHIIGVYILSWHAYVPYNRSFYVCYSFTSNDCCVWMCFKDRSTSPSVLRCVATTWKEGLLNRKRPFVGRCCHSCTPQSWVMLHHS